MLVKALQLHKGDGMQFAADDKMVVLVVGDSAWNPAGDKDEDVSVDNDDQLPLALCRNGKGEP
jgi:hypothetical protein